MAYVLDQSQTQYTDPFDGLILRYDTTFNAKHSQAFNASVTGDLGKVTLKLKKSGTISPGNVWAELWSSTGSGATGKPSSLVATSTTTIAGSSISSASLGADYDFEFASGTTLNSGTQYHIVFNGDYATSTTNYVVVSWKYGGSPYDNGGPSSMGTSVPNWGTPYTDRDLYFLEYYQTSTSIKTINGLAKASVKTYNGLAIASAKSINGLT